MLRLTLVIIWKRGECLPPILTLGAGTRSILRAGSGKRENWLALSEPVEEPVAALSLFLA